MNNLWVCKDKDAWKLILRQKELYAENYFITGGGFTKDAGNGVVNFILKVKEFKFIDPTPLLPMEFLQ